jgi:hypothetical protein
MTPVSYFPKQPKVRWVNWSGLATWLHELGGAVAAVLARLQANSTASEGESRMPNCVLAAANEP